MLKISKNRQDSAKILKVPSSILRKIIIILDFLNCHLIKMVHAARWESLQGGSL